jgi:WD40 repeat protein
MRRTLIRIAKIFGTCAFICASPFVALYIVLPELFVDPLVDRGECAEAVLKLNTSSEGNEAAVATAFTFNLQQRPPINLSNVYRITELQRFGRGDVRNVFWGSDEHILVLTSIGLWRHDLDDLGSPPVLMWDYASGVPKFTVSPNNDFLALQSNDGGTSVPIWSVADGREVIVLQGDSVRGSVDAVAFNRQATHVAAAIGREVYVWELSSGVETARYAGFTGLIDSLAFSNDGNLLAVGGSERAATETTDYVSTLRIYDLSTSNPVTTIVIEQDNSVTNLAFSPDNRILASLGRMSGAIRLWDVSNGEQINLWDHSAPSENGLTFSPDGQLLISGNRVFSAANGERVVIFSTGHFSGFNDDGSRLLTVSSPYASEASIVIWQTEDFTPLATVEGYYQPSSFMRLEFDESNRLLGYGSQLAAIVSSDGQRLALVEGYPGNSDGANLVRVCDVRQGNQLYAVRNGIYPSFSNDGRLLATANYCGLRLWDNTTGDEIARLEYCPDQGLRSTSIAFSSDDQLVAVALWNYFTNDTQIQLWDTKSFQLITTLTGHTRQVHAITFADNNQLIATSSRDGTTRLWGIGE